MRVFVCAIGALLAATGAVLPAAAQTQPKQPEGLREEGAPAPRPRPCRAADGCREMLADKLPFGSQAWWPRCPRGPARDRSLPDTGARAIRPHDRHYQTQRRRHRRQRHLRQRPADRAVRRPLPDGEPRPRAGDGLRAEGDRGRLGIGLVYKTSFDKANRTSLKAKRGVGLDGALAVFAEIRETLGPARRHRRARGGPVRARGRGGGRAADPGLPVPADRPAGRRGQDRARRQGQEGPVPGALGHAQRGRQDHRQRQPQRAGDRARRLVRLQHAGGRHARAADHGPRSAAR